MSQFGDFPTATIDALIHQNKSLQTQLEEALRQQKSLEEKLEEASKENTTLKILDREREADAEKVESELKELRLKKLHWEQQISSSEKMLGEVLIEKERIENRFKETLAEARKFRSLFKRWSQRWRKSMRPKWEEARKELRTHQSEEQRLREKYNAVKTQLTETNRYIQTKEAQLNEENKAHQRKLNQEVQELASRLSRTEQDREQYREKVLSLQEALQSTKMEITQYKNKLIEKSRNESGAQDHLLKRIEDLQSRLFVQMTENKTLQEDLQKLKLRTAKAEEEKEKASTNWSRLRVDYRHLQVELEKVLRDLSFSTSKKPEQPEGFEDIKRALSGIKEALPEKPVTEGANESFEPIQLKEKSSAENPASLPETSLSETEKRLLTIQSECFRLDI